jgi:hypothetical protein
MAEEEYVAPTDDEAAESVCPSGKSTHGVANS